MNITKKNEPLKTERLVGVIYAQPGVGKTSLVASMDPDRVLMVDTNEGAHRAMVRSDVVRLNSWSEIHRNLTDPNEIKALAKDYSVLAFDTVEDVLQMMGNWLKEQKPGLRTNQLKYYGALGTTFAEVFSRLKKHFHIIFIAHEKAGEKVGNEGVFLRPKITGGSYDLVMSFADIVAYMYRQGGYTMIDFNPSDFHFGKNPARLEKTRLPNFFETPEKYMEYAQGLLPGIMAHFNQQSEAMREYAQAKADEKKAFENSLNQWAQTYLSQTDAAGFNHFFGQMQAAVKDQGKDVKIKYWEIAKDSAAKLGLSWSKENHQFYLPPNANMKSANPDQGAEQTLTPPSEPAEQPTSTDTPQGSVTTGGETGSADTEAVANSEEESGFEPSNMGEHEETVKEMVAFLLTSKLETNFVSSAPHDVMTMYLSTTAGNPTLADKVKKISESDYGGFVASEVAERLEQARKTLK